MTIVNSLKMWVPYKLAPMPGMGAWMLLLLLALFSAASGSSPGCDLTLEAPCRSNSTLCVPLDHIGDGYLDCPDGSDEGCPDGWWVCEDRSACVAPDLMQDGVPDCYDESDEVCESWQHECLCGFPRCIDEVLVGDGNLDCLEGSDELSIDKTSYICPSELAEEQTLRRKRRDAQAGVRVKAGESEVSPNGLVTSTVGTFVNAGTTSEYVTLVHATRLDGHYTQLTTTSSRVFFSIPTRLYGTKPEGLVSTEVQVRVTDATTAVYTTRYIRTHIDGTYAQLIETDTEVLTGSALFPTAAHTIPVLGTFVTETGRQQEAQLQVSLLNGPLSPNSASGEIVTLTGTEGRFIKQGLVTPTTYDIFTGSYVNNDRTYLFFFGNSALPQGPGLTGPQHATKTHTEVVVRKGGNQSKIMVEMEKELQVIMPSKTQTVDSTAAPDLLMGEGMVAGRVMEGVFIEGSEGFDMEGSQSESGETSMLTVTISRPESHTRLVKPDFVHHPEEVTILNMASKLNQESEVDNEIDGTLLRARKAQLSDGDIIADLRPSRALQIDIPTYTVGRFEPIEEVIAFSRNELKTVEKSVEKSVSEMHQESNHREGKSIDDIRAKFNLERGGEDSDLPTVTYVGFADFTTTIANTVVVFTPRTDTPSKIIKPQPPRTREPQPTQLFRPSQPNQVPVLTTLAPRLVSSSHPEADVITGLHAHATPLSPSIQPINKHLDMETRMVSQTGGTSVRTGDQEGQVLEIQDNVYSTVSTQRFNTIDLYPTGLVSSIGGTVVSNDMTTLLTTFVYGTYIQGQYAQIVQSTSSIFYLVSRSAGPSVQATPVMENIATSIPPDAPDTTTEFYDLYDYDYEGYTTENQLPVIEDIVDNALGRSVASSPGQQLIVDTDSSKDKPEPVTPQPSEDPSPTVSTLTYYTTYFTDGTTSVATRYETSTAFLPFFGLQDPATDPTPTDEEIKPTEVTSSAYITTYTYHTTLFVDGSTKVSSRTEVVTKTVEPSTSRLIPSFIFPTPTSTQQTITTITTTTTTTTPVLFFTTEPAAETTERPAEEEEISVIEAIEYEQYEPTTESIFEPITETVSESMSESSTDSSAQDVTESPGLPLDSSLNPDDEVNAVFYPRTYYTTYTYFTTYYRAGTSSIVSSMETLTNVVSDPNDQEQHKTLTPVVPTYPVTYYTTYTYWTTFFKENSTTSTSSEKTLSNIVTPTAKAVLPPVTLEPLIPVIEASPTTYVTSVPAITSSTVSSTPAVTTFYTTYTYYTSTYIGDQTIVNSRLQTITNVMSKPASATSEATITPELSATTVNNIFGFPATTADLEVDEPIEVPKTKSTGLLSTIRGTNVVDGTTTIFSTNIIGTIVDGLYAKIQSTTNIVIPPASDTKAEGSPTLPFFFLPTTTSSTSTLPFFFLPTTASSTSTLPFFFLPSTTEEASPATPQPTFPEFTHREIDNAPSIAPVLFSATPTLDSSLSELATGTTSVDTATEALPEDDTTEGPEEANEPDVATKPKKKSTSRNQFPVRPSGSRRRPDIFPFHRRTSHRSVPSTITRDGVTPTVTATPASTSESTQATSANRQFRFGVLDSSTDHSSVTSSSSRFRFHSSKPSFPVGSSRPGVLGSSNIRKSSSEGGFRFGSSSQGSFRFSGSRSSVFPGASRSISPSSVFPTIATTAAPISNLNLDPLVEEEEIEIDGPSVSNNPEHSFRPFSFRQRPPSAAQAGTRSTIPGTRSTIPGTRSSVPFALLTRERRPSTPPRTPNNPSRFTPEPKKPSRPSRPAVTKEPNRPQSPTQAPRSAGFRINRLTLEERRRNRFRQSRPDLTKVFSLRNPLKSDLDNEASEVEPVYVEADGRFLTQDELSQILADQVGEPLVRKKRQAGREFGMRTASRNTARTASRGRSRDTLPLPPPSSTRFAGRGRARTPASPSPSPPVNERGDQFTLTNSNARGREVRASTRPATARQATPRQATSRQTTPRQATPRQPAPRQAQAARQPATRQPATRQPAARQPAARQAATRQARPSTSRTSLPTRPRSPSRTRDSVPLGNIQGRGFRRPSTDNSFRTSSKFTPTRATPSPIRRPPPANRNTATNNRNRRPDTPSRDTSTNPIHEFRNRPSPPITTEAPAIFPSNDGGFLIQDELTVTREAPVKATIPLVENGVTIQKEVITASLQTEVIQPDQITQTPIDGVVRLLLSTVDGGNAITHYVIDPIETTFTTFTPTFAGPRRTSSPVILPTTAYHVVAITKAKGGGDIQQLLQLLLGQQQQPPQNPLLAALGLGQQQTPSEIVHTHSFVTTVTNVVSTAIPIIFRGKTVHTTIVDSMVEVVTATELSTQTVFGHASALPFGQPNPLNQLLPLLLQGQLQQQSPQERPTREPSVQASKVDPQLLDQLLKQQQAQKNKDQLTESNHRLRVRPAPTPAPVETSIVTMYVSGRRPGEFSTILSTVTLTGDATRRKRGSDKTKTVEATVLPHFIETDKGLFELPDSYNEDDMDWFIMSAMNEIDTNGISKVTPSLDSVLGDLTEYYYQTEGIRQNGTHSFNIEPFLWEGPAEFAPLKRNVRSAQRGINRVPEGRKIQDGTQRQIVEDTDSKQPVLGQFNVPGRRFQSRLISEQVLHLQAPTTYYTTFTYYTTLVNEGGQEFVKSSEETITQLATHGNVRFDDFTKTVQDPLDSDYVQDVFRLEDAIIPGKPRPVPDPIFTEPPPPFGPIIRHQLPDPAFELEPEVPSQPPRVAGRRVPNRGRGQASQIVDLPNQRDEQGGRQKPRRVVLTRKRPIGHPVSNERTVVTRRRPVNQIDSDPVAQEPIPATSTLLGPLPVGPFLLGDENHGFGDFKKLDSLPAVDSNKATHEIMEFEEQDQEEEVAGSPGTRRRVRITVTNRRPVQLTDTVEADKTMTLAGGRRRVVVTRRLPQPTVVASPLRPLVATVSTYYTVYSYIYTLYESTVPVSVSTREVTVSNEIEPTAVSVLPTFQTGMAASGLYTLETGASIATLGERIFDGYTTQVFLASATLVNLTPEAIKENARTQQSHETSKPQTTKPAILQSSLAEDESVVPTETPFLTTSSFRATKARGQTAASRVRQRGSVVSVEDEVSITSPENLTPSRAGVRTRGRGTVRFKDPNDRLRVTVTRRRPITPASRDPIDEFTLDSIDSDLPTRTLERGRGQGTPSDVTSVPEDPVTEVHHQRERPNFDSRFRRPSSRERQSRPSTTEESVPSFSPPVDDKLPEEELILIEEVTDEPVLEVTTPSPLEEVTDEPVLEVTTPTPTPTQPTNPPRSSIRRDDIPIIRRPGFERPSRPIVHQEDLEESTTAPESRLRFTPKPKDQPLETQPLEPVTEPGVVDDEYTYDEYYDEYYYYDESPVSPVPSGVNQEPSVAESDLLPSLDESEVAQPSPTLRPKFVRPTHFDITTSSFDIIEALKRSRTYTQLVAPTRSDDPTTRTYTQAAKTEYPVEEILPSNVVYSTYATTTHLPILGGKQSITLTILTSTLTTLAEDQLHLITDSPELFDPSLATAAPSFSAPLPSLSPSSPTVSSSGTILLPEGVEVSPTAQQEPSFVLGLLPTSILSSQDDKTALPLPQDQIISNNFDKFRRPITLPPSTLSDQMLLFASLETEHPKVTQLAGGDDGSFQTNTYFTTYTYYNTLLAGNKPFVITSKQTLENVVTVPLPQAGNFIERTEVIFDTRTYYETQTFTRTIGLGEAQQEVTSEEVLTQVVITEAPSIDRTTVTPTRTSLVTKTYFTTLTYYNTAIEGDRTVVSSDTVVSSEVVTETALVTETPTLSLGGFVLTPTPEATVSADEDHLILYATKTVYTTLTYLTTILEGSQTITTSRVELSSNILTQSVTSALSSEELTSLRESYLADQVTSTAFGGPDPETITYVKIRNNVYKQLRTFFATYTHFTTMHNGLVHSRLETKTKVLTSTITTSTVPASLLITPTNIFDQITSPVTTVSPSFGLASSVQLDPSYLNSLKSSHLAIKPSSSIKPGEEEGLTATVLVEEGEGSGTFVVSDSITTATLLVGPSDEVSTSVLTGQTIVIFDSDHLSTLKSSYLLSQTPVVTQPIPTTTEVSPPTEEPITDFPPIVTEPITPEETTDGITLPPIFVAIEGTPSTPPPPSTPSPTPALASGGPPAPAPAPAPSPASSSGTVDSGTSSDSTSSSGGVSITGSSDNALNIDLGPMFTAVAGLFRNNINNPAGISAKSDVDNANNRRKITPALRPSNTPHSSHREPVLIPVGGVGASLSSSRDHTEGPEHGFIPLRRPGSHNQNQPRFTGILQNRPQDAIDRRPGSGFIKIAPERPRPTLPDHRHPINIDEMEGFGPTFLPPRTQSGFTAMTNDHLGPTRVSVISGVSTIFFGGVNPADLPPPGQPVPPPSGNQGNFFIQPSQVFPSGVTRPVPIPVRVPIPGDGGPIPLPVTPESFSDQIAAGDTQPNLLSSRPSPQRPQPSLIGPQTIVSIEGDNRIVKTQIIHANPVESYRPEPSIIVSPAGGQYVLHSTVGVGIVSDDSSDQWPQPPPGLESTVISGAETVLVGHGADRFRTTVVRGSSTVMSGATTIFGSLFTRPATSNEPQGDLTSVVSGPGGIATRLITRVETAARTITATSTDVVYIDGITSTLTQVIRSTLPLRTIISTIVGTATQVNYITATVSQESSVRTEASNQGDPTTYPPGSPFDPANYPSFPLDPRPIDDNLHLPGDPNVVLSASTFGIAEDNEISRVVESQSPDQEINIGSPLSAPVSLCDPQCSTARYEVCQVVRGAHTCVCRSGYSRRTLDDACKPSLAYNIQVLLDSISDGQLVFDSLLRNTSHPVTQSLSDMTIQGVGEAMLGSRLGSRYHSATVTKFSDTKDMVMPSAVEDMHHGVVADIKVELVKTEEEDEDGNMSESTIKEALEVVLRESNYSLGRTELFTNRQVSIIGAEDFNECAMVDHNDCSVQATCFNTPGSFLCSCRDGFKDMAELPGRECAVQTEQCARCSFKGECVTQPDGTIGCRCLQWFSGNRCQINLRVMLIVLVTVGSLLVLLLLLCLALCCLRARRSARDKMPQMGGAPTFLRARTTGGVSGTLDRRAMIPDTSSESSVDHSRHASSFMPPNSDKHDRVPRVSRSEMSLGRRSHSSFAEDRSVGLHTTLPPVLIPRVKGPAPARPSVVGRDKEGDPRVMIGADARSDLTSSQQAFVDLLDPPVGRSSSRRGSVAAGSMAAASVHSMGRVPRSRSQSREHLDDSFLHQLHPQASTRSRSTDRLHHPHHLHNSTHDLNSEFGVNFSFRGDGERTMSEARSFDETTVRPPIKSMRADSFYSSKALSSQHISDEHQTMAERDGGSTLVYPQTHLYRPVRDTDSLSDMSEQHSKVPSSRGISRNFFS